MQPTTISPAPANDRSSPILVTGSHRSGSTWVGNILALAPRTGYVHEPFNTRTCAGVCNARFTTNFTYVTPENEARYLAALQDTLTWRYALRADTAALRTTRNVARMIRNFAYFETMRRRGARTIMKDPIALFSAEWLAARFDMSVVVMIRHPAAFVASLIAAGWVKFPLRGLLDQDDLMRDRLEPFRDDITAAVRNHPEPVDLGVLLWRVMHHHIRLLRRDHPDWIFVRHEDLSQDPVQGFRDIYGRLGLAFSAETEARINAFSERTGGLATLSAFGSRRRTVRNSKDNISYFKKRLNAEQIDRIFDGSRDVWQDFYTETDW